MLGLSLEERCRSVSVELIQSVNIRLNGGDLNATFRPEEL